MELNHLQVFLAVAEELHFGRAAQRLHMAQPPVSRAVRALERNLSTELFERSTRSVRLTAAGQALIEPAREVFAALDRAAEAVRAVERGDVGLVRIAYAGASTHRLVGELARAVRHRHPGIRLELFSQQFAQPLLDRLLVGDVEIALGRWDLRPAGVVSRVIQDDALCLAVPAGHRLADYSEVRVAELAGEQFVSLPPVAGGVLPDRLRTLSLAAGFAADVVQIAPDTYSALSLVAAEVGCHLTLVSVSRAVQDPHVRFVPISDDVEPVSLRIAWRADHVTPVLQAVLDVAARIPASGGS
ncbi:LysR family transcriptional regulator [Klenkia taihuensis]|uniref:DNA-binding transcriptional regulator, LysR family n=1 Tax=Klenkia taihuensis TaxID=1225127 RepID=A0A1I1U1H5_9ACTN|nr:LysR substrate-binding domain-containing protein [Klenkia taihuensis]GHE06979.1 LysR family transcriptional regulator [Klenkia taihuensis]SFD64716.1 DNA-binding transcriptional regulator, LysR family [Klenkia taihuensis]